MKAASVLHGGFHILINSVQTIKLFGSEILIYYFHFCTFSFEFFLVFAFPSIFMPLSQGFGQWAVGLLQCPGSELGECSAFDPHHAV